MDNFFQPTGELWGAIFREKTSIAVLPHLFIIAINRHFFKRFGEKNWKNVDIFWKDPAAYHEKHFTKEISPKSIDKQNTLWYNL